MFDLYRRDPSGGRYLFFLVLMATILFVFAIQSLPLYAPEGLYGPIAKCILKTGDWLTMHGSPDCDQVFFLKGPLFYWALALSLKMVGINEIGLRLPSFFASVGIVALTYHLIMLVTRDAVRAFLGGLVLLTTHQFAFHQRTAVPDPLIIFFMMVGTIAYTLALDRPRYLFWVGFLSFFPMLIKPVFPGVLMFIVAVHLFATRRLELLRNRYLYYGLATGALPFVLWNLHQYWGYGAAFLYEYWGLGILGTGSEVPRIDRPRERAFEYVATFVPKYHEHAFHPYGTVWFYPMWLALFYHPWLALIPSSVARVFKAAPTQRSFGYWALLWIGALVIVLSAIRQQGPGYLLLIYPMLAALIAGFLDIPTARNNGGRDRWSLLLLGALVVFKLGQLGYVSLTPGAILPAGWRFELALTAMSIVALGGWLVLPRLAWQAVVIPGVLMWSIMASVYLSLVFYPQADMSLTRLRSYVTSQPRPIVLYAPADWVTAGDVNALWWYFDDLRVCRTPECVTDMASQLPVVLATSDREGLDPLETQQTDLRFLSKLPFKLQLDSEKEVVARRDMYVFEFVKKQGK